VPAKGEEFRDSRRFQEMLFGDPGGRSEQGESKQKSRNMKENTGTQK
jgi:hypothetical protein